MAKEVKGTKAVFQILNRWHIIHVSNDTAGRTQAEIFPQYQKGKDDFGLKEMRKDGYYMLSTYYMVETILRFVQRFYLCEFLTTSL